MALKILMHYLFVPNLITSIKSIQEKMCFIIHRFNFLVKLHWYMYSIYTNFFNFLIHQFLLKATCPFGVITI